jgi:hypothetical protein
MYRRNRWLSVLAGILLIATALGCSAIAGQGYPADYSSGAVINGKFRSTLGDVPPPGTTAIVVEPFAGEARRSGLGDSLAAG